MNETTPREMAAEMDEMELMMRLHRRNRRQGPGSDEATLLALALSRIDLTRRIKVADVGCGTGAQTVTLAKAIDGDIVAVDLFGEFLDRLSENIAKESCRASVTTLAASMDDLPFAEREFDMIWSEGAVYNMGFRRGIGYWRRFLKEGGILAVSELSWLTPQRPAELDAFWTGEYPEIDTVAGKIKALEEEGYGVLGHFVLPDDCWLDNYYLPLAESHKAFLKEYGDMETARRIVETDRMELEFYNRYKEYYGYGFYVARKIGR